MLSAMEYSGSAGIDETGDKCLTAIFV